MDVNGSFSMHSINGVLSYTVSTYFWSRAITMRFAADFLHVYINFFENQFIGRYVLVFFGWFVSENARNTFPGVGRMSHICRLFLFKDDDTLLG